MTTALTTRPLVPHFAKRRGWVCVATLALSACSTTPPPPTIWLALPAISSPAPEAAQAPTLIVQRLRVPEYLQTSGLRYRDGLNTFAEWPQARWAERIEVNLTRHLSQSLQARLPQWRLCEAPCSAPGAHTLQVVYQSLEIQSPKAQVLAVVQWQISPPTGAAPMPASTGQWRHEQAIDGPTAADQVSALAHLNELLSDELAQALKASTSASTSPATAVTPPSAPTPSPGA